MEQLVREGKVTYIGSSNFAAWDMPTAQSVAASRHCLRPLFKWGDGCDNTVGCSRPSAIFRH